MQVGKIWMKTNLKNSVHLWVVYPVALPSKEAGEELVLCWCSAYFISFILHYDLGIIIISFLDEEY